MCATDAYHLSERMSLASNANTWECSSACKIFIRKCSGVAHLFLRHNIHCGSKLHLYWKSALPLETLEIFKHNKTMMEKIEENTNACYYNGYKLSLTRDDETAKGQDNT